LTEFLREQTFNLPRNIREGLPVAEKQKRETMVSLAKITVHSGLTPDVFTDCLLEAWKQGKALKGKLRIEKKNGADEEPIFLFMLNNKILGSFHWNLLS